MWKVNKFPVEIESTDNYDLSVSDDPEVDALLQLQKSLIRDTEKYVNLIPYAPKTIPELKALEATCFLAVVENRVGLDGDLLETCFSLLGISYGELRQMTHILGRMFGIITRNLVDFIIEFAQKLRSKAETLYGG